jgi:phosphoglucosamine mutase
MLASAVAAGLAAEGVDVIDLGVVPTPVVAAEAARHDAIGLVISASHNPHEDNGIKVFGRGGMKLTTADEARIEADIDHAGGGDVEPGTITLDDADAVTERHIERIRAAICGRSMSGLSVVVDAANGAASHLAAPLLTALGAQVTVINADPDGRNINAACGATNPSALADVVVACRAHVGLALDGDADRLIAVDELGQIVDGDHLIAICAGDMAARGELATGAVVVTVMANLGFRLAMEAADITVIETPVGDRHVLEALVAGGHSIGGEQSGHVIWPSHATTGDGLLTGVMLLDVVARSGRPLSVLASEAMTSLPQVLLNVRVADRTIDAESLLAAELAEVRAQLGAEGRVLIRPSGTEPLIRIMVEANTDAVAAQTAQRLADALTAMTDAPGPTNGHG